MLFHAISSEIPYCQKQTFAACVTSLFLPRNAEREAFLAGTAKAFYLPRFSSPEQSGDKKWTKN